MIPNKFSPGFRISAFDVVVLALGAAGAIFVGMKIWWAGMIIGFVIGHFFLFCNVFRISRRPGLIWAAVFTVLATSTILTCIPGCCKGLPSHFVSNSIISGHMNVSRAIRLF